MRTFVRGWIIHLPEFSFLKGVRFKFNLVYLWFEQKSYEIAVTHKNGVYFSGRSMKGLSLCNVHQFTCQENKNFVKNSNLRVPCWFDSDRNLHDSQNIIPLAHKHRKTARRDRRIAEIMRQMSFDPDICDFHAIFSRISCILQVFWYFQKSSTQHSSGNPDDNLI